MREIKKWLSFDDIEWDSKEKCEEWEREENSRLMQKLSEMELTYSDEFGLLTEVLHPCTENEYISVFPKNGEDIAVINSILSYYDYDICLPTSYIGERIVFYVGDNLTFDGMSIKNIYDFEFIGSLSEIIEKFTMRINTEFKTNSILAIDKMIN